MCVYGNRLKIFQVGRKIILFCIIFFIWCCFSMCVVLQCFKQTVFMCLCHALISQISVNFHNGKMVYGRGKLKILNMFEICSLKIIISTFKMAIKSLRSAIWLKKIPGRSGYRKHNIFFVWPYQRCTAPLNVTIKPQGLFSVLQSMYLSKPLLIFQKQR